MSTNIIRRPPKFSAAAGPLFYTFSTNEQVLSPGSNTIYQLLIITLPLHGTSIKLGDLTWTLKTSGVDPNDAFQIDIGGLTTTLAVAQAIADAVTNNAWLTSGLYAGTPVVISTSNTLLSFSYDIPREPDAFTVLDPSGNPYPNTPGNPITPTVFPGNAPEIREQFAVYLQLEIEQDYRQNSDWHRLPVLRLPADTGDSQALDFQIDRLLQASLGFDLPAANATKLQPALTAFRLAKARYWTSWFDRKGGIIRYDEIAGTAYIFHVLNAVADSYAALPHHEPLGGQDAGCTGQSVVVPQPLESYFKATASAPQQLLASGQQQHIPLLATGFLAFYANPTHPDFGAPNRLTLMCTVRADGQTTAVPISLSYSDLLTCEDDIAFAGQIWSVPLQLLWTAIATEGIALDSLTEVCVWLENNAAADPVNLVTAGEAGTFDGNADGWNFTGATPSISGASHAGSGALDYAATLPADTSVALSHTAPIVLQPNTSYRLSLWFRNPLGSTFGLFGLNTNTWGLDDATINSIQRINTINTTTGWEELVISFTTGGDTSLQLSFSGDITGEFTLDIDSITLIATGERQLTSQHCYQILPGCQHETLLYQNKLGLPETLHFVANPRRRLQIERQVARAKPERLQKYNNSTRGSVNYANAVNAEVELVSFPIPKSEQPYYEALLQSSAVYWLQEKDGEVTWQPVVLTDERFTLYDPKQDLQQLSVSIEHAGSGNSQTA